MRASHINCFIAAVQNVFKTMLETDVTVAKPRLRTNSQPTHDVSGVIVLSGDVAGAVAVSFPLVTALNAAEAFSGTRHEQTSDEFSDAIGELANMVSGNAKKDFDGLNVMIGVPTVVVGRGHRLGRNPLGPWIVLDCLSRLGGFTVEVCVLETADWQINGGVQ